MEDKTRGFYESYNDDFCIIDFVPVNYLTPPTRSREIEQWNIVVDIRVDVHHIYKF